MVIAEETVLRVSTPLLLARRCRFAFAEAASRRQVQVFSGETTPFLGDRFSKITEGIPYFSVLS
jgi:hypothetical protein